MAAVLAQLGEHFRASPLLGAYACFTVVCTLVAAVLQHPLPLAGPAAVLILALAVFDLNLVFYLCLAGITFSTEVELGPLSMDLPVEPLMILLAALGLVLFLVRSRQIPAAFYRHPISVLLALHVSWIALTTLTSAYPVTSVKFLLAKLWYVIPFYFLGAYLVRDQRELRRAIAFMAWPVSLVFVYCLARHAALGFAFEEVNAAMFPFFRNHVSYAALGAITFPLFAVGAFDYAKGSWARRGLLLTALFALLAVQTSYTRAAYVSLLGGLVFYLVIRYRLTRLAVLASLALAIAIGTFVVGNNRFFNFAPDYNKTVTQESFSNLLEATYKLEDISTMERVYRWVAGAYMTGERPWFGFGPGNFYRFYKGYTLEAFRTYVSDNPEKSGIHSYFLMTLVEQGWIGLILFVGLAFAGLFTAERAYHRVRTPAERRAVVLLAASLVINLSFQLINDMIETDKSGPLFFFTLAMLVNIDRFGLPKRGSYSSSSIPH